MSAKERIVRHMENSFEPKATFPTALILERIPKKEKSGFGDVMGIEALGRRET